MRPNLSILIPTYNRARYLERLLLELADQSQYLPSHLQVKILISDNSSVDDTFDILSYYCGINCNMSFIRNPTNIGADKNILSLLDKAKAPYCWIIGDDDMPIKGLLNNIVSLILNESPSLIYLESLWGANISSLHVEPILALKSRNISNFEFAEKFHVWTTFLSSWIFNIDQLLSNLTTKKQIATGLGTGLAQLGWILPLLASPQSKILAIDNICILATSGNSGGYSIVRTFLLNYPKLVFSYTTFVPRIRDALVSNYLNSYMPRLIISVRLGRNHSVAC